MSTKETIFELRKQGFSYSLIGEKIGVSRQRIHQIVKKLSQYWK